MTGFAEAQSFVVRAHIDAEYRCIGSEDSSAAETRTPTTENAVSDRATLGGLTQSPSERPISSLHSLNSNVIASALGRSPDVWENLVLTARKLFILKTERCPSG